MAKVNILHVLTVLQLFHRAPLAQCDSLKRLNISYTKVEDLSPLDGLPLECFVYVKPKASQEELDRFGQLHPDCVTSYENNEYGYPWRYEQDGSFTPTAKLTAMICMGLMGLPRRFLIHNNIRFLRRMVTPPFFTVKSGFHAYYTSLFPVCKVFSP